MATFSVKLYEFDPSLPTGVELPTAVYICFPTSEAGELIAIWPGGGSREGTLVSAGKPPMQVAIRGRRGHLWVPNVHLLADLLPNQVARCLMGQAIDQTV